MLSLVFYLLFLHLCFYFFFFFNDTATTEIYTLSLHDALPIRRGRSARREIVLRARTGVAARAYPAAAYGGAVDASAATTVIVGRTSVTSYDNRTGRARWRRRTGRVPQAWRVDGTNLYVTIATGGYLGTAPVTGLRQISLRTGAQRVIRLHRGAFDGALSGAFDGVVLFSG